MRLRAISAIGTTMRPADQLRAGAPRVSTMARTARTMSSGPTIITRRCQEILWWLRPVCGASREGRRRSSSNVDPTRSRSPCLHRDSGPSLPRLGSRRGPRRRRRQRAVSPSLPRLTLTEADRVRTCRCWRETKGSVMISPLPITRLSCAGRARTSPVSGPRTTARCQVQASAACACLAEAAGEVVMGSPCQDRGSRCCAPVDGRCRGCHGTCLWSPGCDTLDPCADVTGRGVAARRW